MTYAGQEALRSVSPERQIVEVRPLDPKLLDLKQFESWGEMVIANDDDEKVASNRLGLVAAHAKNLKKERDYLLAPLKEAQRRVTELANKTLYPLETIDRCIRSALGEWLHKKRIAKEIEERRLRDETARKLKEEADKKLADAVKANSNVILESAAETEKLAVSIAAKEVHVRPQVRNQDGGTTSTMVLWKWEVADPKLVPREFLIIDETALNILARGYKKNPVEVPGIRFFETTTPVVRR